MSPNNEKADYLDPINALRGFGAFVVILYHLQLQLWTMPYHLFIAYIPRGYLAVDMFFLISGFVITHVYFKRFLNPDFSQYKQFIFNRLIRIYPVHLATMAVLILLEGSRLVLNSHSNVINTPFSGSTGYPAILSNLLLIQAWHIHPYLTWNFPAWSISAEWFAYLFAPFIVYFIGKIKNSIPKIFIVFFVSVIFMEILNTSLGKFDITYDFGPLRTLFGFCMGSSLYAVFLKLRQKQFKINYDWLTLLLIITTTLLSCLNVPDIVPFIVNPFILLTCLLSSHWIYRILTNKTLFYWGEMSYSMYMTHGIVINQFFNFFTKFFKHPNLIQMIMTIPSIMILSFIVAYLTYEYIENPARKFFKNKFSKKEQPKLAIPSIAAVSLATKPALE